MESFGDEIGAAGAKAEEPAGARPQAGRPPSAGGSLYGEGVPTAASYADDGWDPTYGSYADGGPPTEPIPGLAELISDGDNPSE